MQQPTIDKHCNGGWRLTTS
jgi:hypothetical protein